MGSEPVAARVHEIGLRDRSVGDWPSWSSTARWRVVAAYKIDVLRSLVRLQEAERAATERTDLPVAVDRIKAAERANARPLGFLSTRRLDEFGRNFETAEALLLRGASDEYLLSRLPSLVLQVQQELPGDDPRRVRLEQVWVQLDSQESRQAQLLPRDRDIIVGAASALTAKALQERNRLLSYQRVLLVGAAVLAAIAAAIAVIGLLDPSAVALCFTPQQNGQTQVVCPLAHSVVQQVPSDGDLSAAIARTAAPLDLAVVELFGLLGAVLSSASLLRSTSAGVMLPRLLIKLFTGALTAVLGLLLIRGEFIPGFSTLESQTQIVAYAIVFGIAQQLLTRPLDQPTVLSTRVQQRPSGSEHRPDEELLQQIRLAVPAMGPALQEALVESAVGPPTPPYNGFVAVQVGTSRSPTTVVWFQTTDPGSHWSLEPLTAAVRLRGSRWPEGQGSTGSAEVRFEVRLHVPRHPASPFSATILAPVDGISGQARFDTGDLTRPTALDGVFVEVNHGVRLIQVVQVPGTTHT